MAACTVCEIVDGTRDAHVVLDTGSTLAFLDMRPVFHGHTLVVPKAHHVTLPDLPYDAMRIVLVAEAAAAFDELTRSGRDRELVQQGKNDWANTFRAARFIPAVDYVNAMRARTLAMRAWDALMSRFDAVVTPTSAANLPQLVATNLTGHPAVIVPNGFRDDGTPVSLTFLGPLFGEGKLLALANAYQQATGFQTRRPPGFG